MKNETILNNVINYKNKETVRFHMPGHKGRIGNTFLDAILPYDVTELSETGDLLNPHPESAVTRTMELAEKLFGAKQTIISVSGATLALQAAVFLGLFRGKSGKTNGGFVPAAKYSGLGGKILCSRNLHRSVVYAMALCGAEPVWLENSGFPADMSEISAAIITSPDYYGKIVDVKSIAEKLKQYDIPLIVDHSHGAHLAFHENGRLHALKNGGTLVVDSLHKTLPAMTGCALLHSDGTFDRSEMIAAMRIFSTTSPSFILQSSVAACLSFMHEQGTAKMTALFDMVNRAKETIRKLGFDIADRGQTDPYRLCIIDENAPELYRFLAENSIVCEFADDKHVVLIPTVMNIESDFDRLVEFCDLYKRKYGGSTATSINRACAETEAKGNEIPAIPDKKLSLREALFASYETVDTADSPGKICAEPVTPYPPGVPLVMPGELYSEEYANLLIKRGIMRVNIVKQ